jgi:phospholipid-binding lipoprotein MlaA
MTKNTLIKLTSIGLLLTLSGCASTGLKATDPKDPYENWNRKVQGFNDNVDNYVMKPVAKGYNWVTPTFVNQGVSNFFSNLDDIGVSANDLFQGKFAQSGLDSARFLVNTSVGVAGFVDVGSKINLPKHNEDFDQTLGYWGVGSGPYLVLPFFGPSTMRGVAGLLGDAALNPISYSGVYLHPGYWATAVSGGLGGVKAVDVRADNLTTEKVASEAAVDRYDFFKNAYLQQRNYLIKDGNVPEEDVLKDEGKSSPAAPLAPYKK